jgi:UDP-glucose 4-epimerase
MRMLVTGGLGVNGSWVTRRLLEAGHEPVVLDVCEDTTLVADIVDEVEVIAGDTRELAAVERVMRERRIDRVIHMAALLHGVQSTPYEGFQVNAGGTINVVEAAVRCGVSRVVFASSRAAYGGATGEYAHPIYRPMDEDYWPRPRLVYDVLKVACEWMGRNYSDVHGIDFIALRFAHIVGPGKGSWSSGHSVCSRMIEESLAGRPVVVDHGGDQRDDIIYAADMAEGVLLAAAADVTGYRLFNISRGEATTLGELADAIRRQLPKADITIGPGLNYMDAPEQWYGPLDNSRARRELGFRPRFDLDGLVQDWAARTRRPSEAGNPA